MSDSNRSRLALPIFIVAALSATALAGTPNLATTIDAGGLPVRVHVFEDYETEIEKRWWLRGEPLNENLALSLSASAPNTRACRATATKNFDQKMGDQNVEWKAVIFNPVPGPPMGPRTRLSFRYRLDGTDTMRVQIYSLSNNYHRFLTLEDLPTGQWQRATVDMTKARRPDGSGGPLSKDERIDDIQFYLDPAGELLIDDIVLYEAAVEDEERPFPARVIFTGWFDTGEHGKEWPGEFEIVPHEKPRTWDAAKSVVPDSGEQPVLRVNMRGERTLSQDTSLFFRYKLTGNGGPLAVSLTAEDGTEVASVAVENPATGKWSEKTISFSFPRLVTAHNIVFHPPAGSVLLVDDILLHEPGH